LDIQLAANRQHASRCHHPRRCLNLHYSEDIQHPDFALDAISNRGDEILDYLDTVALAVRIVQKEYPDAVLYIVEAAVPRGSDPTPDPLCLSQLRVVFRAKDGTVIIRSTSWDKWGKTQFIPHPWDGCVVIPWPIKMDITDAVKILRKAGYTDGFWMCKLKHSSGPPGKPYDEPYYSFLMAKSKQFVFVGVNDGAIYVNKAGQDVLPKQIENVRA